MTLAPGPPKIDTKILAKIISMGLSSSEDRTIIAQVILTQCQRVTDGWTDRQIYYSY